jgi:hypothetical protein
MAAWKQFVLVAKPYWLGDKKKAAWALLALLIVLMLAETQFAVMLNNQSGEMTSALAGKDADRFWKSVRACLGILAFAVPIYAFITTCAMPSPTSGGAGSRPASSTVICKAASTTSWAPTVRSTTPISASAKTSTPSPAAPSISC